MMDKEWTISLRMQIEALASRNEANKRLSTINDDVRMMIKEMDEMIITLRELVARNTNDAAHYYFQCVAKIDEIDKTIHRNAMEEAPKKSSNYSMEPQQVDAAQLDEVPQRPHWWDQFQLHRKTDLLRRLNKQNDRRELWRTQKDFFLSCLGFMVGVGHTMRFPAKVYQHGGGVFFIPYLILLVFFGLPLVFLHLSIGQFTGRSANAAFQKLMPIGAGLGWALVVIAIPVAIYYNIIVAWAIHYFFQSATGLLFGTDLPWETCREDWQLDSSCCNLHSLHECFNSTSSITAPEAFFHSEVLSLSTFGDFTLGPLQSHLVLSLAAAWFLVFLGVCKGLGSIGSTMNVTATVPYLLLSILLLRGISLPGANKGLSFLFSVDDNSKLWSWSIWKSAAEQVFYELGIDAGPLISMAAFSRFRNNIYRDSVLLVVLDAITSTLSGMVIFSFVGFIASESNTNVNDVLQHDPLYLSFTVYPGVTSFMYWGGLWATLFFGMLVLAALDAEFAWLEMIASAFMNHFATKDKHVENRLLAFLCLFGFLFGLPLCAEGGIYVFHAIENLNANWNSFSLALLTVLLVCYIYGVDKFLTDISGMIRVAQVPLSKATKFKEKLTAVLGPGGIYITYSLCFICPITLTALLIASAVGYQRVSFADRPIPIEYEIVAWIVMVGPLLVIPIVAFVQVRKVRREGKLIKSLFDTSEWSQDDFGGEESQCDSISGGVQRRRTPTLFTHRENTYMYIDSRGPTVRSKIFPRINTNPDPYGWTTGRIRDKTGYSSDSSMNSFMASTIMHQKLSNEAMSDDRKEVTLFGAPPVNPSLAQSRLNDSINTNTTITSVLDDTNIVEYMNRRRRLKRNPTASDPPIPTSPPPPPPRASPSRSEPPAKHHKLPVFGNPRRRACSSSNDPQPMLSDEEDENMGINSQRTTVIRRFPSDDDTSTMLSTPTTESMTPADMARQRSLSSVAIYDNETKCSSNQVLSVLKRPAPIDMPFKE